MHDLLLVFAFVTPSVALNYTFLRRSCALPLLQGQGIVGHNHKTVSSCKARKDH